MKLLQLLAGLFCCGAKEKSKADVINGARADLEGIGSVFRKTINEYRTHAEDTMVKADAYRLEAEKMREAELTAREAELAMIRVADEAADMADKIENSLGFGVVA